MALMTRHCSHQLTSSSYKPMRKTFIPPPCSRKRHRAQEAERLPGHKALKGQSWLCLQRLGTQPPASGSRTLLSV